MNSITDQHITLKSFPEEHSTEAFKKEFYFEAIAVLHGYLESQMRVYFHMYAANITKEPMSKTWDASEKLTYVSLMNVLFILNLIEKSDYDVIVGFNTLRNELMHRYYSDPYEGTPKKISKSRINSVFKSAMKTSELLFQKIDGQI